MLYGSLKQVFRQQIADVINLKTMNYVMLMPLNSGTDGFQLIMRIRVEDFVESHLHSINLKCQEGRASVHLSARYQKPQNLIKFENF